MKDKYENLFDLSELKNSVMNDNDFLATMLETFVETNIVSLTNMKIFIVEEKWIAVGEVAHKMLSSYKHLQIVELVPVLQKLELLIFKEFPIAEILQAHLHVEKISMIIFEQLRDILKTLY